MMKRRGVPSAPELFFEELLGRRPIALSTEHVPSAGFFESFGDGPREVVAIRGSASRTQGDRGLGYETSIESRPEAEPEQETASDFDAGLDPGAASQLDYEAGLYAEREIEPDHIEPQLEYGADPDEEIEITADADITAEAAPHPHHCFEISTHRSMDLTADGAPARPTVATASTPPRYSLGPQTRFRTIAGLGTNFPTEIEPTSDPTQFLETTRGRVLLDTGHFRVDPANASRFQVRIRGLVCHPARTAGSSALGGTERLPVAVIVHGNHAALEVDLADSGDPRRTVSVTTSGGPTTLTLIPATASQRHEVLSYRGYRYLQEHLATQGIVSVSIDTNAANELGSLIRFRADLVLEMLDHLRALDGDSTSAFHERLDFSRIALVGHSRGGDAVAMAAELNRRRSRSTRYGVRAVVAIAPTDFTGMLASASQVRMRSARSDSFLCIQGSHDGDVSGTFDPADRSQGWGFVGTGFRHYDRASTQRAMVFIHGATHNRFNAIWVDPAAHSAGSIAQRLAQSQADNFDDEPTVDPRKPASTSFPVPSGSRDARVISEGAHQSLAREYVGGWLELWLLRRFAEQRRFVGAAANSLGIPVALQWKLGRSIRAIDNFDDATPGVNVLGGATSRPSFIRERLIELADLAHSPHHDRVLEARAPSAANPAYRSAIPSGKRDFSSFSALTFRISKRFPNLSTPSAIAAASFPPNLELTLFDGTRRASVDHSAIALLNPQTLRPYHRIMGSDDLTKVHMQTWTLPLTHFTQSGGVSLSSIQAVEITFNAGASEPIHLDTLSLVRI